MGDLDLPCNTWCFRPMRAHNPNGTSIGSAVFAQLTAECPCTGLPVSPSKLFLSMLASAPHVIHGSMGPPESGTQIATWSFQPFLQGSLVWQTDRATDRPTYRPRYSVRGGVIMRNYVGYGKATHSFHVSTNNFATIKSLSVRLKHLIKYLVWSSTCYVDLHCSTQASNTLYVLPFSHLNTGIQAHVNIIY